MINRKCRESHKELGCPILPLLFGQSQEEHIDGVSAGTVLTPGGQGGGAD